MNYIDESEKLSEESRFLIQVMIMYIEDYEFLYECIGVDASTIIFDIEQLIIDLVNFQGDCVYYNPLAIA